MGEGGQADNNVCFIMRIQGIHPWGVQTDHPQEPISPPNAFWKGVETGERRPEDGGNSLTQVWLPLCILRAAVFSDSHKPNAGEAGKRHTEKLRLREAGPLISSFIHLFYIYRTLGGHRMYTPQPLRISRTSRRRRQMACPRSRFCFRHIWTRTPALPFVQRSNLSALSHRLFIAKRKCGWLRWGCLCCWPWWWVVVRVKRFSVGSLVGVR